MSQRVADAVGLVTTTEAVMVEPLVTEAPLSVTPTQVPKATVAPDWKPPPEIVMAVVVLPAAPGIKIADGLTVEISLPRMVKIGPEVKLPPSALVTVTVYVPGVAGIVWWSELTGVTEAVIDDVGVISVAPPPAGDATQSDVPSTVLVKVTTGLAEMASATKPPPAIVIVVAPGLTVSGSDEGVAEVTVGSPYTVKAPAFVAVPPLSVTVMLYEPGTVAEVDAKVPVMSAPVVFARTVNVTPGAVVVTAVLPPSPAKVPATSKVPEAPVPK
jgi:hypothetical protein